MENQTAYDPTVAVVPTVEVAQEMSMAELLEAANNDMGSSWVEGDYKLRLTAFSWHYSDNDKALGLINSPRGGCAKFEFTVTEGPGNTEGKTYKEYFHFKAGVSNGHRWDGERDLIKWLTAQGINVLTMIQPVVVNGVRMVKDTYSPIGVFISQWGGDYVLKMTKHKTKEGEFNTRYTTFPVLFDEQGNPLQRPVPTLAPVVPTPVAVAQPVAEIPVAVAPTPVAVAPVVPVAQVPTPVAEVPVQPVAQIPTPVAVAPVIPVAEVPVPVQPVVPVAVPTGLPTAAPVAQIPTGLPTGLPV